MARLGHRSPSGAVKMWLKASLSMPPQVGRDRSPRPRKSSPASIAMAMPATPAARMMAGARTTVRMWREMIRASLSPDTRAASTYSSCFTPDTSVCTTR